MRLAFGFSMFIFIYYTICNAQSLMVWLAFFGVLILSIIFERHLGGDT